MMLTIDEVSIALLETKNIKQPSSSSHTKYALVVKSKSYCDMSK